MSRLVLLALLAACTPEADDTGSPSVDDTGGEDTASPCTEIALDEGSSGTYTVDSSGDDHVKHHWVMPEGQVLVAATATWDQPDWTMALGIGEGWCPHSGDEHASATGTGGTLEVQYSAAEAGIDAFEADRQWFVHMGVDMPVVRPEDGETSAYTFAVLLCPADAR